jgi:hypothetical protein
MLVRHHVPTEMIPALAAPFALARPSNPLPDITATNVNRSRAVEQNIDTLPAFFAAKDRVYVNGVPGPHLSSVKN